MPEAITTSPRNPRVPAGNDSTSVTLSLPRNWRLRARMRVSDTSATQRSPFADAGANLVSQGPRPRIAAACSAEALLREGESGHATLTRRRAAAIGVVGLHDGLHELVTHHVALVEVGK